MLIEADERIEDDGPVVRVDARPVVEDDLNREGAALLDRDGTPRVVELDHAIRAGVVHVIAEDRGTTGPARRPLEDVAELVAVENVVAQHKAARAASDKLPPDDERLGQSLG